MIPQMAPIFWTFMFLLFTLFLFFTLTKLFFNLKPSLISSFSPNSLSFNQKQWSW